MPKKSQKKGRITWDSELGGYYGWVQVSGTRWNRQTVGYSSRERAIDVLIRQFGLLRSNIEVGGEAPVHEQPVLVR